MSSGWGGSGLREETRAPGAASRRLSAAPAPGYATRMAPLSRVRGVLETCLYASDLAAAERFYADVIGLEPFQRAAGRHVFFRCGAAVFLVFDPARTSTDPGAVGGAPIPAHGTEGPGHVAFAVPESDIEAWRDRLTSAGVAIESEVHWPKGGRSLYVRDPAGNSVEIAAEGIWR
jgi:catechol 2,3-dioxygenase-like lactoylglutathione lyase family enzyme